MRPDGIYYDVTRAEYDAMVDRENWSRFKLVGRSPAHYHYAITEKEDQDSDSKLLGRACHHATLEPDKFRATYVVWDGGRRSGNAWEDFCRRAEREQKEILTEKQHETALAISKAVRSDAIAKPYVSGGRSEATVLWTAKVPRINPDTGEVLGEVAIPMKSRLDFIANVGAIVDMKTTGRAKSLDDFWRQAHQLEYHVQGALYRHALQAAGGPLLPYKFVLVETEAPNLVTVINLGEPYLTMGRDRFVELLVKLAHCKEQNDYPGYAKGEVEFELPSYAMPYDETDPDGLGLEFAAGK